MSLITSVYLKHKLCNSTFWDDDGGTFECVAIQAENGQVLKAVTPMHLYRKIEWMPHEERLRIFRQDRDFEPIERIKIIKEGWFALSKVRIFMKNGRSYNGKTDKGFARLIDTVP